MGRPRKVYDYYRYNTYQHTGTVAELSQKVGLAAKTFDRMPRLKPNEKLDPEVGKHHLVYVNSIKASESEYALYKGEDLIAMGTMTEIAEVLGIKRESLRWYQTPAAQKRGHKAVLVPLDDDEEEIG
ncbi:hypothetical protein ACFOU0_12310 [Salinicoccus sesuvii]|uniref:Uncharacterized protein n=1 Tax=Salinicoccus sesuvii TaxID=868281 RepID=A0ABV7N701_9STAP